MTPFLLLMGALFFALAIWSKRLSLTYLCVVFFIGMQDLVEVLAESLDAPVLGGLLDDPSGVVALDVVARYWTIAEQNSRLPGFSGDRRSLQRRFEKTKRQPYQLWVTLSRRPG